MQIGSVNTNYTRKSWFNSSIVASTFASYSGKNIVSFAGNSDISQHFFLLFESGSTKNLLPSYGYCDSSEIPNLGVFIKKMVNQFQRNGATTAFLPVQGEFGTPTHHQLLREPIYIERNPSFCIDLTQSQCTLRSKVSRRRRPKLIPNAGEGISFCTSKLKLSDFFIRNYEPTLRRLGANLRFLFSTELLSKLLELDNTHLVGVLHNDNIEMVLMHGMSDNDAEFVFSTSTEKGQKFSTFALWQSTMYLKELKANSFHLGGGIQPGDGVEDFKRQFGGKKLFNGGLRLVFDGDGYKNRLINTNTQNRSHVFFPAYLENEVLGRHT